jgi:hypothetical protein
MLADESKRSDLQEGESSKVKEKSHILKQVKIYRGRKCRGTGGRRKLADVGNAKI